MSRHSDEDINRLQDQLNRLVDQQVRLQHDIQQLQLAIDNIAFTDTSFGSYIPEEEEIPVAEPVYASAETIQPEPEPSTPNRPPLAPPVVQEREPSFLDTINWERFLGENLISKIGILILIIGVAIGAKYAIDNEMISPLMRIVAGYLTGIALVAVSFKLKKKYESFSAVLLSGGLTILYFITYLAYSLYELIPQTLAFGLMVLFTAFTVLASLRYNQMLIALLGMVGAYAVPFLLSDGSGRVHVLFIYMFIINTGILVLAFYRNWKVLLYAAFGLSWLIYLAWFLNHSFEMEPEKFGLAIGFATAFFLLFYIALLAYPLTQKELIEEDIAILIPINGLLYFGIGLYLLDTFSWGEDWLGAFALLNAALHLLVVMLVKKRKAGDKTLTYLIIGMVFLFVSLAVPLQLDGYPVTLIWIGEAALLLWVARKQGIRLYERSAYILVIVAFFSLIEDWLHYLSADTSAFINLRFLTGLLFSLALGFIYYLYSTKKEHLDKIKDLQLYSFAQYALPTILLIALYITPWIEIKHVWSSLYDERSEAWNTLFYNQFEKLNILSTAVYTLWFFIAFVLVCLKFFKQSKASKVATTGLLLSIAYFMLTGLLTLAELRDSTLQNELYGLVSRVEVQFARYFSLLTLAVAIAVGWKATVKNNELKVERSYAEIALSAIIVWLLSSEIIDWLSWGGSVNTYRFGLTVLWGICALILVILGMVYRKKHLRILAMALFGVSLAKVFLYDLSRMETLGRTVVLVALGVLLLLISFLYNKNKHLFADEEESQQDLEA